MSKKTCLMILAVMAGLISVRVSALPTTPKNIEPASCAMTSRGLHDTWAPYANLPDKQFKQKTGYEKAAFLAAQGDADELWKSLRRTKSNASAAEYRIALVEALNSAILWQHRDMMRTLVRRGAPLDGIDGAKAHPLLLAISCRDHEAAGFLLDHGADMYVKAEGKADALWEAVTSKDSTSVDMLLDAGFDPCVDHARENGRGALVYRDEAAARLGFSAAQVKRLRCSAG